MDLGFNIDHREAISVAYEYLHKAEIEFDRENHEVALKMITNSNDILDDIQDEQLKLEYELLECQCTQKLEMVDEAIRRFNQIASLYPKDPRALLCLAELSLNNEDYIKNKNTLAEAEKIDANHWLLKLEHLVRKSHLQESIDINEINEKDFPDDQRIKSNFYRLYAHFLEEAENKVNAEIFIEKALRLNSDRFSNYVATIRFN